MEQKLIKELNEQIIKSFNETKRILEERINSLESIINNENADEKLKSNVEVVLKDIEKARDNIDKEIKRMVELADKNKAVFFGEGTFTEKSKYSDKLESSKEKNETIDKNIEKLENLKLDVSTEEKSSRYKKAIASVNKSLDKRIAKLRTKKGKIEAKQRKIVNKATEQKLREYLGRVNIKDIERQKEIEKKIANSDEEIDKLNTERAELGEMKDNLPLGLGIKVAFNEKLTQARINRLKAKRGILKFRDRHMIQANVNKNLIAKMKEKVVKFSEAIGESIKAGINEFKEAYEEYMNDEHSRGGAHLA